MTQTNLFGRHLIGFIRPPAAIAIEKVVFFVEIVNLRFKLSPEKFAKNAVIHSKKKTKYFVTIVEATLPHLLKCAPGLHFQVRYANHCIL